MASIAALWNRAARRAGPAALLIVAVLGVAAYTAFIRSSGGAPGDAPIAPLAVEEPSNGPSTPTSTSDAAIGSPLDPLPSPLAVPADSPDATASTLARMVSAGGIDALPALLFSPRTAGITAFGPVSTAVVVADGPGQGVYVSSLAGSVTVL